MQTNCYVVTCSETQHTAVIDPSWDGRNIAAMLTNEALELTHILITHAHFDHVGGLGQLKEEFPAVPVYIHPDAAEALGQAPMQAALFGMKIPPVPQPEMMIIPDGVIRVGNLKLEVLYTPGHAVGHVSFYNRENNVVFSGDALFQGSIGRTDFPGSDFTTLMNSIETQLLTLPDETHVLSGHGPATTIGRERASNPFLQ